MFIVSISILLLESSESHQRRHNRSNTKSNRAEYVICTVGQRGGDKENPGQWELKGNERNYITRLNRFRARCYAELF